MHSSFGVELLQEFFQSNPCWINSSNQEMSSHPFSPEFHLNDMLEISRDSRCTVCPVLYGIFFPFSLLKDKLNDWVTFNIHK